MGSLVRWPNVARVVLASMFAACGRGHTAELPHGDSSVTVDARSDDAAMTDARHDVGMLDAAPTDAADLDASHDAAAHDTSTHHDSGTDAGEPTSYATRAITGPTYRGSDNNSAQCITNYATRGFAPIDDSGRRHPLFLYFVGTAFSGNDSSARYDSLAPLAVTEAMARRGFIALSAQYDNSALAWLSDHQNQLACLFGDENHRSLLAEACAMDHVDCDLGIATWGHSQGAYVAVVAHNLDTRVRAAWATGYGSDVTMMLPSSRLRVVNGEADSNNGNAMTLNRITGLNALQCLQPDHCLRDDGSGWIIVRARDLDQPLTSSADHCWFDRASCASSVLRLEPAWVDPMSSAKFALEANADWVAATARRR